MREKLLLCGVAAGIVVAAVMPASATTKTVTIPARRFDPEKVTIFVGDTVRWVNTDDRKHSVTATSSAIAKGENFDSNPNCSSFILSSCLTGGDTYSHTFTHSGVFTYYCRVHGSDTSFGACDMCGQVVVKKKGGPPGSLSPSTSPPISPSTSVAASPGDTATASPSGTATASGLAGGASSSDDGAGPTLAIAAIAVVILAASGLLVYRTLLRR
ncbi:MAG: cupredoxin domain-containing protein [Actinomycetota bacterium]